MEREVELEVEHPFYVEEQCSKIYENDFSLFRSHYLGLEIVRCCQGLFCLIMCKVISKNDHHSIFRSLMFHLHKTKGL